MSAPDPDVKISKVERDFLAKLMRRLRFFGPERQYLSLETDRGHAFLAASLNAHNVSNGYWDGAAWQRFDTTRPAALTTTDAAGGMIHFYTAPAGANPIVWGEMPLLNPLAVSVYHSVNQSVANNSNVIPVFDSEEFDPDGYHAAGASTLIVPAGKDGLYVGVANLVYATTATGGRYIAAIGLNGTTNLVGFEERASAAISIVPRFSVVTRPLRLVAGDNLRLLILQASGAPLNLTGGQYGSTFAMHRLGGY